MAVIPLCYDNLSDGKRRRYSLRTKLLLFWIEFLIIASTLISYFIYAFKTEKEEIGDRIAYIVEDAMDDNNVAGAIISGGIFWVLIYIVGLCASLFLRVSQKIEEDNDAWGFICATIAHIVYHLIRWPIFVAIIFSSVSETATTHYGGITVIDNEFVTIFVNGTDDVINGPMVVCAFWLDMFLVVGLAIVGGVCYGTAYGLACN